MDCIGGNYKSQQLFGAFVAEKFEKHTDPESDKESYTMDDIREQHPKAYRPWSTEDDEKLEASFCEVMTVQELANIFERKVGAITSRIRKLELREKYS
ncbi:hypothetical protein [Sphingobacterium griseoflavum]|uniref:Uncharacterized protein n=1 Tax=Sphingobacterium griseoflavum TaxID=1474952 RepID=A0ABQ3HY80_9SPHI|nr:hypothetical protein [Sphingobacterium griseoflavum]GHE31259.1 hypothetical protein GCM10017764_12960 [Sphingobacterium griseoflavum]